MDKDSPENNADIIYEKALEYAKRFPDCKISDIEKIVNPGLNDGSTTMDGVYMYNRLADEGYLNPKVSKHFLRQIRNAVLNSRDGIIRVSELGKRLAIGNERAYRGLCYLYKKGMLKSFEGVIDKTYDFAVTRAPHIKRNWQRVLAQALTLTRKYGRNDIFLFQKLMFVDEEDSFRLYQEVEDKLTEKAGLLSLRYRGELSAELLWRELKLRRKTARIVLARLGIKSVRKGSQHKLNCVAC